MHCVCRLHLVGLTTKSSEAFARQPNQEHLRMRAKVLGGRLIIQTCPALNFTEPLEYIYSQKKIKPATPCSTIGCKES